MNAASLTARTIAAGLDALVLGALAILLDIGRVRVSAYLAGGPVAPWAQPLRDLVRLSRKRRIRPDFASPLHGFWPLLALAATITLTLLVPVFTTGAITARFATPALIVGLLALGRAARVLAALDAGTGEAGLTAARAALAGVRTDLAWLFAFAALGLGGAANGVAGTCLAVGGVLLAAPADPIVPGDYAGPDRVMFIVDAMLRRAVLLVILVDLAAPAGLADAAAPLTWPAGLAVLAAKLLVATAVFGVLGVMVPRGAPTIGLLAAVAALSIAVLGPFPVDTLGLAAGLVLVATGLILFRHRMPAIEAAVLVQGGIAMIGFALGSLRGGMVLLAGLVLARLATEIAGSGKLRLWALAALAGLPPFGLFVGDYLVIAAAARVSVPLALLVVAALGIGVFRLVGPDAGPEPALSRASVALAACLLLLLIAIGAAPLPAFPS